MKQRNTTKQTIDVPGVGTVEPGEVVDHKHPISGFTPVRSEAKAGPRKQAKADEPEQPESTDETASEPDAETTEDQK